MIIFCECCPYIFFDCCDVSTTTTSIVAKGKVLCSKSLYILASTAFGQVTNMGLLAIPMFVLMANLLIHSGIADRLFQTLSYWLSGVRGSLAVVSVGVSTSLAMCGGF